MHPSKRIMEEKECCILELAILEVETKHVLNERFFITFFFFLASLPNRRFGYDPSSSGQFLDLILSVSSRFMDNISFSLS